MRSAMRLPRTNWLCVPLTFIVALAVSNVVLTHRPQAAGAESPYSLDQGTQAASPVIYWIDHRFAPEEEAAIRAAFDVWQDAPDSRVSFIGLGDWSASERPVDDGRNVVLRSPRSLQRPGQDIIARTVRTLEPAAPGQDLSRWYRDTDIELDFSGRVAWSTDGSPGTQDLQGVVAHEVGHLLGLDDVSDPTQMMYWVCKRGDASKRRLSWGDLAGLYAAYPHEGDASASATAVAGPYIGALDGRRSLAE